MRFAIQFGRLLLGTSLLLQAQTVDRSQAIWMEIPGLSVRVEGNSGTLLSTAEFDTFQVRLSKQSNQVNYGSITSKINTESANIVMSTVSTDEGIVCRFDLSRHAGFKLKPGRNSVEIAFYDRWNRLNYASFLLQTPEATGKGGIIKGFGGFRGGTPSPESARPERITSEKFAVIVGVSKYQNSGNGLQSLKFADRDASSFKDFLLSPEGGSFPGENVRFLVNEAATSQNLRTALFTFLTKAKEQDVVVLYFAGHGSPDPNDRRNLYLLTYDTKLDDMGGTAFPMWQLQDVFSRIIKARRVVTFTDSCHSFGISGQSFGGSTKSNNLINQYLAAYATTGERAVITASDISELSAESDQWGGGHGVFTFFLLKGLKGEADANKDGTVTAGELFPYVREQVQKATAKEQTPIALPGLAERLPLSGLALAPEQRTTRKLSSRHLPSGN